MQNNFEEHIKAKLLGNSLTPSENVWNQIEQELRNKESFEFKLKEKTDEFTFNNLSPNIWQQIEEKLNKKRKRRALLWLVLAIGTASASMFTLYKFQATKNDILVEKRTASIRQIETESKLNAPQTSKNATNKPSEKSIHSGIQSSSLTVTKTVFKFEKKSNSKKAVKTENTEIKTLVIDEEVNSNSTITTKNNLENTTNLQALSSSAAEPIVKESNTIELVKGISTPETKNIEVKADSVAENLNFKANTYSKQNEKKYGNWALILGIGFNYTGMQLMGNNQPNLAQRQAIESPSIDWNTNLLAFYQATQKWGISTGIGITHFKQNLNFNKTPAKGNIAHPLNANSYVYEKDSISNGNQNALESRYTFVELPFNLNYQFKQSDTWSWQLQVGYAFGILYHVDAYQLDPNNIGFVIVNSTDNFPQFNATNFVSIAPKMEYQINKGLNLGMQLNCKTSINSIIQTQNWIQQRPYLLGFELSLKKRF
jgi:hypothetical protein